MGTGLKALLFPIAPLIERINELEKVRHRNVDVCRQFGDLGTQFLAIG